MCICNIYSRVHFAGRCTRATNTCARNSGATDIRQDASRARVCALFPRRSELSAGIETLDFSDDDEHGEESTSATCVGITGLGCARDNFIRGRTVSISADITRVYIRPR